MSGLLTGGRWRVGVLDPDGDLLARIAGCLQRLGALPPTLVGIARPASTAADGRPSAAFAGFCAQLRVGGQFCGAFRC
ncbi:hypothetical protein OJ998_06140 [Solirubrobacter taibaiensis]|nr:hypothetical protein [Solirubrobacter taibaiensis]